MADTSQTAIEIKALLLAVIVGILVVGLAFGVAAVARKAILPHSAHASVRSSGAARPAGPGENFTAQMITAGAQIYPGACASCHGASAKGAYGPNLRDLPLADSRIAGIIKNGKGQMPAFGKQYNDAQINDLVGYLRSLK